MNYAIILAAGKGNRMGSEKNKVFLNINQKPVLYYSIKKFYDTGCFDGILVVFSEKEKTEVENIINSISGNNKKIKLAYGGSERQDSVLNGINGLKNCFGEINEDDKVLIHDGARALVSEKEILEVLKTLESFSAVTVGVKVKDTIKITNDQSVVIDTPDRETLWQIQTPQGFKYKALNAALRKAKKDGFYGTDDCSLVERCGIDVKIINGSYENIKITTPEDLFIAEAIIEYRKTRKLY